MIANPNLKEPLCRPAVLHVVHSLECGGMEHGVLELVRRGDVSRVRQSICTMRSAGRLASRVPDHVSVTSLNVVGSSRFAWLRLVSLLRLLRPDVVHARNLNTWTDVLVASAFVPGVQCVLGFHGLEREGALQSRMGRRARWLGLRGRRFTTVSEAGFLELVDAFDVPEERISILPNGVDMTRFRPPSSNARETARRSLGVETDETVWVMVGSLVEVKNHGLAISALRRAVMGRATGGMGKVRLLLAGDGPLRESLKREAVDMPDSVRVEFLGRRSDVVPVLHAADGFLLCSQYEQMSRALLEAMACGVPCIVTDVGDNASLVGASLVGDGQCGLMVPEGDVVSLSDAIERMTCDVAFRKSCKRMGADRVGSEYDVRLMVERYMRFYEAIIAEREEGRVSCAASLA